MQMSPAKRHLSGPARTFMMSLRHSKVSVCSRGVVVWERGGTPFWQIRAGTALRQISLATGGTLTLKRSGKSRRTR